MRLIAFRNGDTAITIATAMTATATPAVAEDIMERLGFREKLLLKSSFERPNLSYIVRHCEDKFGKLLQVCSSVPGTGIVYVRSRKRASEISGWLEENGVTVCHIDNPLVMDDFESNTRFVEKTEKADKEKSMEVESDDGKMEVE